MKTGAAHSATLTACQKGEKTDGDRLGNSWASRSATATATTVARASSRPTRPTETVPGNGFFSIEKGHFGEVSLDGLKLGGIYAWPGPIHEGKGKCQIVIDAKRR